MPESLLTPAELTEWLNVKPSYVYEHAASLGAIRLGDGPRARLRFDLDQVRRALPCYVSRGSSEADTASTGAKSPRRRKRMGTNVELLPIRGRSEVA